METELASLRADVDMRKQREAILEWEVENLKKLLTATTTERDTFRRRSESLKVLLDQTGSALVAGIQKFNATERDLAASLDNEPLPKFLTNKMLADTVN